MAIALVRHKFHGRRAANLLIVIPMATPEVVIGASLLSMFIYYSFALGFWHAADRPRDVLDQLRGRRRALAADRLRPPPRGGRRRSRRNAAGDLLHRDPAVAGAGDPRRGAARLRPLDRRLRHLQFQLGHDRHLPALRIRSEPARNPGAGQRTGDDAVRPAHRVAVCLVLWQQRRAERMAAVRPEPIPVPGVAAAS